jgi:hypothetical protein
MSDNGDLKDHQLVNGGGGGDTHDSDEDGDDLLQDDPTGEPVERRRPNSPR